MDLQTVSSDDQNQVLEGEVGVGEYGGTCTCPDGEVLLAGAIITVAAQGGCGPLACEGGTPGLCNHYKSHWAHRKVCAFCSDGERLGRVMTPRDA